MYDYIEGVENRTIEDLSGINGTALPEKNAIVLPYIAYGAVTLMFVVRGRRGPIMVTEVVPCGTDWREHIKCLRVAALINQKLEAARLQDKPAPRPSLFRTDPYRHNPDRGWDV